MVPLSSAQFTEPVMTVWYRDHASERGTIPTLGELTVSLRISHHAVWWFVNESY